MPPPSATASPMGLDTKLGPGNAATAVAPPSDESPADSAFAVAQAFWGLGNLTPMDYLFESTAIMTLAPSSPFAFIGRHFGRRLHRYSEDTRLVIDAFESHASLSRLYVKKSSTVRLNGWSPTPALVKKGRYAVLITVQPSAISDSLQSTYSQCANGLKSGGRLFAADLVRRNDVSSDVLLPEPLAGADKRSARTLEDHNEALRGAGLSIERNVDLTDGLLAAIRGGFFESIRMAKELRENAEPSKSQRRRAFCQELETWGRLYMLLQKQMLCAVGLLAVKPTPTAKK